MTDPTAAPRCALRGWRSLGLVVALFTALAIPLTWPFAVQLSSHGPWAGADTLSQFHIVRWETSTLLSAPRRFLDANTMYPNVRTLAYSDFSPAMLALVLVPYLATDNALLAQNLWVFVGFGLAGLCGYLLVRLLTGQVAAGLVAGTIMAFAPMRVGSIVSLMFTYTFGFVLGLYWFERYLLEARRRYLVGLAATWVLQSLTSVYMMHITAVGLGVYAAIRIVAEPRLWGWRQTRETCVAAVAAAGLVGLYGLPYFLVQRLWGNPWDLRLTVKLAARPLEYLQGGLFTSLLGIRQAATRWDAEQVGLGAVATALTAVGIWWSLSRGGTRGRARGLALLGVLLVGGVLSLGPRLVIGDRATDVVLPYGWLSDRIPGFAVMRNPGRFGYLVLQAAAVFAGMAAAQFCSWSATPGRRRLAGSGAALILGAGFLWEVGPRGLPTAPVPGLDESPPVYRWLAARPHGGPIAEVPYVFLDTHYRYFSSIHWRPHVQGLGAFVPPTTRELLGNVRHLPDRRAVAHLAAAGVRQVLVHHDRLSETEAVMWREPGPGLAGLTRVARVGATDVYDLPEPPRPGVLGLAAELEVQGRPDAPLGVRLHAEARDGLWVQPPPFGRLDVRARWICPGAAPREVPVVTTLRLPVVLGGDEHPTFKGNMRAPEGWERCQVAVGLPSLGVWSEPREAASLLRPRDR